LMNNALRRTQTLRLCAYTHCTHSTHYMLLRQSAVQDPGVAVPSSRPLTCFQGSTTQLSDERLCTEIIREARSRAPPKLAPDRHRNVREQAQLWPTQRRCGTGPIPWK
jgi:hypothetical protein